MLYLKHRYQRLVRFEFWPFWLFYAPFFVQWLINSFRSSSFTYFMRANPGMKFGGLFQDSKYQVLRQLDSEYLPQTHYFQKYDEEVDKLLSNLTFPLICKPDIGERGKQVFLLKEKKQWDAIKERLKEAFLIQEFIDYKLELGILYYQFPEGKSGITSVVSKGFLEVEGDGNTSLRKLIENNLRANNQKKYLFKKFESRLDEVIERGDRLVLEEIGNHCRGTTFYDSNHLINEKLIRVFDEILQPIEHFYYGRVDLKVASIEDLYLGKNIKIIEVNGVNSEVTHIFDPEYSLMKAYKDVSYNLELVYQIAKKNKGKPSNVNFSSLVKATKKHFLS